MRQIAFIILGILVIQVALLAQPLVGLKKTDIVSYMRQYEPGFALDNAMVNKKYNYLKYYDKINEETLLCFLNDNDICNLVRRLSDYSNLDLTLKKLDKDYKKTEVDKWSYIINNEEFAIELKREKWYFTLETRRKK